MENPDSISTSKNFKDLKLEEQFQKFIKYKEKNAERQRDYYEQHYSQETTCECGRMVVLKYLEKHKQTDLHKKRLEKKESKLN